MADLIDREVARTTICEKCENYSTVLQECKLSDGGGWCKVFSLYDVPTVDAKPVRHGRWIPIEYDSYADGAPVWDKWECSECCHEHKGEEDTLTAFCPDCGARMSGGDDNG